MINFKFIRGYPEIFRIVITEEQRAEFESILGTNPCREVPITNYMLIHYDDGTCINHRRIRWYEGNLLRPNEALHTFSGSMGDFFRFYQIGMPEIYSITRIGNGLPYDKYHLPMFNHIIHDIKYVIRHPHEHVTI